MQIVRMRGVQVTYPGAKVPAIDGLDLDISKGEMVAVLGRNGAGKSTLLRLVNGLVPHAVPCAVRGTVEVFGRDVSKRTVASMASRVGTVFQEPESQLFCMSVEEEVAFGPENLAVPRDEIRERVDWALETVGLKGLNDRSPSSLSGGQKQRLAIAAALSMRPDIIALDEPAYALDPVGRAELYTLLRELRDRQGVTIIFAERDGEDAALHSERVLLMDRGRLVADGVPEDILTRTPLLTSAGVAPPQMAELSHALVAREGYGGLPFITVDSAEAEISRILDRRVR
jgi:energy-coupling factor transporter ATP-binding protein EcfA2